jgi:nitrite reductase/ring-hydroxylating ferredoxin subunit
METSTIAERWVAVAEIGDLRHGRKVVRVEDRQIAIFQVGDRVYAVDNRCPHMGYPLSQGSISGTTLTCDWHNYKFSLEDGACASRDGGEDVRAYGAKIDAGRILLNLADEPVELAMARHLRSLRFAMYIQNEGRAARDAARLLMLGMRPAEVMREGAMHSAEREEYGWGHALAVIADCTSLTEFYDGERMIIPVVRALTSAADPVRRYKRRRTPGPETPDVRGEREFRRRIEEEDVDGAEAWLRGAVDGGIDDRELSRWLLNAATDHFLGFGHQMIYVFKAAQLAEAFGWDAMRQIIPSIVPSIAWATRYDKLPEMRKYIAKVREIEPHLGTLVERQKRPNARFDGTRFRNRVLFGRNDDAFEAVHGALSAGVHVDVIARELVLAASERMLRMDLDWEVTHEERVWDEGGWLEVTHLLTHANANRQLLRRGVTAEALRSLYHSAWFINWQKRFDATDGARADSGVLPEPRGEGADELAAEYHDAVIAKRFDEAMGIVRAWGRRELPKDELLATMGREATECDDGEFIMMAHVLKTTHAAIQEHRAMDSHAEADLPLMAATRYLASPRKMNPVYDLALNAAKFVKSGAARSV